MSTNRLWTIGAVVLILAILVGGWLIGISPKLSEASASAASQAQVDAANATSQSQLVLLEGQYKNIAALKAKLSLLELSVPGAQTLQTFVAQVNADATSAGIGISSITISPGTAASVSAPVSTAPVPAATATPTPTPTPAATASTTTTTTTTSGGATPPAGQLYTIQVQITLFGSIASSIQFDKLLQTGPRLYLNTEFSIAPSNSGPNISLTGYLFIVSNLTGLPAIPTATPTGPPAPSPTSTSTSIPTSSPTPTNTP